MQLWEYLLDAGALLEPDDALDWLRSHPWGAFAAGDWWTERAKETWPDNRDALSRLALALGKVKRARRRFKLEEVNGNSNALAIAFGYVGLMRPRPSFRAGPSEGPFALNYLGIHLVPTYRSLVPPFTERKTGEWLDWWRDDLDVFWQLVFHSLLVEGGPALCVKCGALLGDKTPTGRPKKQRLCGRCRQKACWSGKTPTEKRKKWRRDYRKRTQNEQ